MTTKNSLLNCTKHPYLRCPASKSALTVLEEGKTLYCPKCEIKYPVREGIPMMVDDPQITEASHQYFEGFSKKMNKRNHEVNFERRWKKLLKHTNLSNISSKGRILEIGAGEGEATSMIQKKTGLELFGLDYAFTACKVALNNVGERANFIQSDACTLPFEDKYFDLVYGNAVLHHIDTQATAVKEAVRVCKTEGDVVFIEPNRYHPLQHLNVAMRWNVEKGTLKLNPRKIAGYLKKIKRVVSVKIIPHTTLLFSYQKFPPNILFPLVRQMEILFDLPLICTNYMIVAKVSGAQS